MEGMFEVSEPSSTRKSFSGLIHDESLRKVGVAVELRLLSVDDENEAFKVAILIHTSYKDPSLKKDLNKRNGFERVSDWAGFIPVITMVNCMETQFENFVTTTRVNYHNGSVWTSFYNTCVISESLELDQFPFDRQLFRVTFKSANSVLRKWREDTDILDFPPITLEDNVSEDTANACFMVACELKHWFMAGFDVEYFSEDDDPASLTKGEFEITIMAERDPKYYFFNYYFTMYLIVVTNVCLLSIDPIAAGERNAVTITLLLTLVAFKFVLLESTPEVGYFTYMDVYVIMSFVFTMVAVVENIFISPLVQCALSKDGDCDEDGLQNLTEEMRKVDISFQIIFFLVWTAVNLGVFLTCFFPRFIRESWQTVKDSQIGATDETVQRTSKITDGTVRRKVLLDKLKDKYAKKLKRRQSVQVRVQA